MNEAYIDKQIKSLFNESIIGETLRETFSRENVLIISFW